LRIFESKGDFSVSEGILSNFLQSSL